MSILNKMKKINSNNAAQLFERHPLAEESHEMRLQYLAGLALATAIDREPTEEERQVFSLLASSMSVDAADAAEQLNERASVSEDDIAVLFDAIRQKNATWIYLLDLTWLHAADGTEDKEEEEVKAQLVELLKIDASEMTSLRAFAFSLKNRDFESAIKHAQFLPNDSGLKAFLPQLLRFQRYEVVELVATHAVNIITEAVAVWSSFRAASGQGEISQKNTRPQTLTWSVSVGDKVDASQIIAINSVTQNKVKLNVVAPFSGVIRSITVKGNSLVAKGDVVGTLYRTASDSASEAQGS